MRTALNNILKPKTPISRRVKVVKKISGNKYQVVDVYGRLFNAHSDVNYKSGTNVVIQNGIIVRETGEIIAPTVYKG